nr:reverse transcriptase domain-containing protein [Tanacetum cinerariifolium]
MAEYLALADLDASINLMPLFVWNKLYLPDLSPTYMTLELADRLISHPVGVAEDVFIKVGTFHFPADFIVVDFDADPQVPLILEISFLKTGRVLIDVFEGELTLQVKLKDLPPHLEYAFLQSDNKLPVNFAKDLCIKEKAALITVLKSHKQAIAWKFSDIKGIDPEFCTHKILMEEDYEPVEKTTFACPYRMFAYRHMPFGLCNAPGKFQRPIHYASKIMTEAESNYTTTEKEMLTVVYAFEKFRSYLIMNKSIVYTDHFALKYLFAKKDSKAILLQEFTFKVIDTKGAENLAADHLSRLENPHQNMLDPKGINKSFLLETLNLVSTRGNSRT